MEDKKKTNKKFRLILGVLLTVGLLYGGIKFFHALTHEETDDAQIQAHMNSVIPRVKGYIQKVLVKDNQKVKKGDTLFIIDPADYKVQLEKAKAGLAAANSQLQVTEANIGASRFNAEASDAQVHSVTGNLEAAEIQLWRASQDFERYKNLFENHSIPEQQYEEALAAKQEAEKRLEVLKSQQKATSSQRNAAVSQAEVSRKQVSVAEANVLAAQAALDAAQLDLDYTVVTAPIDGQLSNVNLEAGQFVQQGQSLFYLVNTQDIWVVANFKETQLESIALGLPAVITVDAYPDEEFHAKVAAFSPATGARFSLLPPDNATGNFVKTVQRLPVKIDFTENNDPEKLQQLRSGMNVQVDVHLN